MKVNETDPRVNAMAEDWALIDALLGGTRAMRAAGERYLPRWSLEDPSDYAGRLKLATLFPALEQTLKEMTGRMFADQIELGDDVPAWISDEVWPDIDRQGVNGHTWARGWFYEGLGYGMAHALVESPPAAQVRTLADQKAAKARPYVIMLKPDRILGWQTGDDGQLSQVRITWSRTDPGDFGPIVTPQIRVYSVGKVDVYEERETTQGKKDWVLVDEMTYGLPIIPLVTFYAKRAGILESVPPLRELAYLNAKHWAHQCSTDSLLQTAQVPILATFGLTDESRLLIGSKNAVNLPQGGDMRFIEHSGVAIGSGRESIKDLEGQMKAVGAKLLEPGAGTKTATQASEEASSGNSPLGAMVEDLQDALNQLLYVIGLYRGEPTGGSVEVKADLDPDGSPIESMGVIGKMVASGGLSKATQFAEAQRRGIVSPELGWEDEQARVQTEGPATNEPAGSMNA